MDRKPKPRPKGRKAEKSKKKAEGKASADSRAQAKLSPAAKAKDRARRLRYIQDIEALIYEFPKDIEAKALLANQLWLNSRRGLPIVSKQANDALIAQVFAEQPMHPAHHYRIHLWDKKETAERVVDSAIRSGLSAPGIAHMWHMGGHSFDKLKRFSEAAWQQEASARVDHAYMMRERVMPFRIHNYAHNQEWCVRSLLAVGRVNEALGLAKNLVELPRHPKWNAPEKGRHAASYGRRRLIQVLTTAELWDEALRLADTAYLEEGRLPADRAARRALLARACVETRRLEAAQTHLKALRVCIDDERKRRARAVDKAEDEAIAAEKKASDVDAAMRAALAKHGRTLRELRGSLQALEARLAFMREKDLNKLRKHAKKARAGDGLVKLWLAAGQPKEAVKAARAAVKKSERHVIPLANLVHALWSAGQRKDAQTEFRKLRKLSSEIELEHAPFARLAPVAESLGLRRDEWRAPRVLAEDLRERPDIATLGPLHWAPQAARSWKLPYAEKTTVALESYRCKPVLVIFFLGFGCVHCVEQLQALKPHAKAFAEAGIEIVAIGTDSADEVANSLAAPGEGYRFPILSDPKGDVFRSYRCWDDFEDVPLHGSFLVDANGLVRWQDIGFEPFMETEFLLAECKRLLGLPVKSER